jgi:CPA1 family monovalent cation:H+ antiporter
MSSRTRIALFGFWEYLAFVINSLVFLLIGIAVHVSGLLGAAGSIAVATAAVVLGRLFTVYVLTPLSNRFSARIPLSWQHVLFWGGLHGSVSMALALGLPADLPGRTLILQMTFGVVAWSIVVQGGTMGALVGRLGLRPRREETYDRLKAEQLSAAAARDELAVLHQGSLITTSVRDDLNDELAIRLREIENAIGESQKRNPALADEERRIARLRLALAERAALERAIKDGVVSDQAARAALSRATETIDGKRDTRA